MGKLKDLALIIAFSGLLITSVFLGVTSYLNHLSIRSLTSEVDKVKSENFALNAKISVQNKIIEAEDKALDELKGRVESLKKINSVTLEALEKLRGDKDNEEVKGFLSTPIPDDVRRLLNN